MSEALSALTRQAEGIWQSVVGLLPGFSVEVLPRVESTNSELMRRAREGALAPTLLVTPEQTAGRGRQGRAWLSRPGDSLTFSLGLEMAPASWAGLSLAVGCSIAEALHPEVRLKWPNDLWWQGRKLGGILVETASIGARRVAVIGVGLNLRQPPAFSALPPPPPPTASAPPDGPEPAAPAALDELPWPDAAAAGRDAGQWLARLVPALAGDLRRFEREGFLAFGPRFAARDALAQQAVRVHGAAGATAGGACWGTAQGVTAEGALRLQTTTGVLALQAGEVSVRPC